MGKGEETTQLKPEQFGKWEGELQAPSVGRCGGDGGRLPPSTPSLSCKSEGKLRSRAEDRKEDPTEH